MAKVNLTVTKTGKIAARECVVDDAELKAAANAGHTAREIAELHRISRQAVSYRAQRLGLSDLLRANQSRRKRVPPPSIRSIKYGMPDEDIVLLVKNGATRAFTYQRRSAIKRGIAWEFSFAEWWRVWSESGKWDQRGVGSGKFVMGRTGDVGPYAAGNVYICTHNQNSSDTWKNRPHPAIPAGRAPSGKWLANDVLTTIST